MLKLSACVLLLAATVQGRVVLTDLHYTTRVVPARWSPKVNALVLDQALDCQYHYSVARANEASDVLSELEQLKQYLTTFNEMHGDALRGAKLAQLRIQRAITKIYRDMRRAQDHDANDIEDSVAAVYEGLW